MPTVFSSIHEHECIEFMDKRPKRNLILEKDLFTGRWNVLDAS